MSLRHQPLSIERQEWLSLLEERLQFQRKLIEDVQVVREESIGPHYGER
jgi:hypothetical protein